MGTPLFGEIRSWDERRDEEEEERRKRRERSGSLFGELRSWDEPESPEEDWQSAAMPQDELEVEGAGALAGLSSGVERIVRSSVAGIPDAAAYVGRMGEFARDVNPASAIGEAIAGAVVGQDRVRAGRQGISDRISKVEDVAQDIAPQTPPVSRVQGFAEGALRSAPTTVAQMGAMVANPVAGVASLVLGEGGQAAQGAEDYGVGRVGQAAIGLGVGLPSAALEKVGLDALLGRFANMAGKGAAREGAAHVLSVLGVEPATEAGQEIVSALGEIASGRSAAEVAGELPERMQSAAASAAMMAPIVGGAGRAAQQRLRGNPVDRRVVEDRRQQESPVEIERRVAPRRMPGPDAEIPTSETFETPPDPMALAAERRAARDAMRVDRSLELGVVPESLGEARIAPSGREQFTPPSERETTRGQVGSDIAGAVLGEQVPPGSRRGAVGTMRLDQARAERPATDEAMRTVDDVESNPATALLRDFDPPGDPPGPGSPSAGSDDASGYVRDLVRSPHLRDWYNKALKAKRSLADHTDFFDVIEGPGGLRPRMRGHLHTLRAPASEYRRAIVSVYEGEHLPGSDSDRAYADAVKVMRASTEWLAPEERAGERRQDPATALGVEAGSSVLSGDPNETREDVRGRARRTMEATIGPERTARVIQVLESFRRVQDRISNDLLSSIDDPELRRTIDEHMGTYLNRHYLLHVNPDEVMGRSPGQGGNRAEVQRWERHEALKTNAAEALIRHHTEAIRAENPGLSDLEATLRLWEREAVAGDLDTDAADMAAAEMANRQAARVAAEGAVTAASVAPSEATPPGAQRELDRIEKIRARVERPGTPGEGKAAKKKLGEAQARLDALLAQDAPGDAVGAAREAVRAANAELLRAKAAEAEAGQRLETEQAGLMGQASEGLRGQYEAGLGRYMKRFASLDSPANAGLDIATNRAYLPRSIWKHRGDLLPEVRELFGEVEDPVERTVKSVELAARFLETQRAYNRIMKLGTEQGLIFPASTPDTELPGEVTARGKAAPSPPHIFGQGFAGTNLAGAKVVDDAFHKALMDELQHTGTYAGWSPQEWSGRAVKGVVMGGVKAASYVKYGKVVLGTQPQARNFTSAVGYTLLNSSAGSPFGVGGFREGTARLSNHRRQSVLAKRMAEANITAGEQRGALRRIVSRLAHGKVEEGEWGESLLDTSEFKDHVSDIIEAREQRIDELIRQNPELDPAEIRDSIETRPSKVMAEEGRDYFEQLVAKRAVEEGVSVAEAQARLLESSRPAMNHYIETVAAPFGVTGVQAQGLGEVQRFREVNEDLGLHGAVAEDRLPGLSGRLRPKGIAARAIEKAADSPLGGPVRAAKRVTHRAEQAFNFSDEQARVFTWMAETNAELYKRSGGLEPPATQQEAMAQIQELRTAEKEAGEKAANLYQNYDRLVGVVRFLRDFVPVASFPGFPSEVVRNMLHVYKIGASERQEGLALEPISAARRVALATGADATTRAERTYAVGARRMRRAAFALSVYIPAYTAALSSVAFGTAKLFSGSSDDDEDREFNELKEATNPMVRLWRDLPAQQQAQLDEFLPEWFRGLVSVRAGTEGSGKVWVMDRSYPNPAAFFDPLLKAALSGDVDQAGKALSSVTSYFGGAFISPDISTEGLIGLYKGLEESYALSHGPLAWTLEPLKPAGYEALKTIAPAQLLSASRVYQGATGGRSGAGRTYDPAVELISWSGPRLMELDVYEAVQFSVVQRQRALSELRGAQKSASLASGAELALRWGPRVDIAETKLRQSEEQLQREVSAARGLGLVENDELFERITAKGLTRKNALRLMSGEAMVRREEETGRPKRPKRPSRPVSFEEQLLEFQRGR